MAKQLLSRRGGYSQEHEVYLKEHDDENRIIAKPKINKKDPNTIRLKEIDSQRKGINKNIRKDISVLKSFLEAPEKKANRDNLDRYINSNIYSKKPPKKIEIEEPKFRSIDLNDEAILIYGDLRTREQLNKLNVKAQEKISTEQSKPEKNRLELEIKERNHRINLLNQRIKSDKGTFRLLLTKQDEKRIIDGNIDFDLKIERNNLKTAKEENKVEITKKIIDFETEKQKVSNGQYSEELLDKSIDYYFKDLMKNRKVNKLSDSLTLDKNQFQALLNNARNNYRNRKQLDAQSKSLRKNEDKSYKKMYDVLRNAKKEHLNYIVINNTKVPISEIKKDASGYIIPKKYAPSNKITISIVQVRVETQVKEVIKTKAVETKQLTFERDLQGLYTTRNLSELFNNAEKETGARIIYLNNVPLNEQDFILIGKKWYLTPLALSQLNLSLEENQKITFKYSFQYSEKEAYLTFREKKIELPKERIIPIISYDTYLTLAGDSQKQKAHVSIFTKQAISAISTAQKIKFADGNAIVFVVFTKYQIHTTKDVDKTRYNQLKSKLPLFMSDAEKKELKSLEYVAEASIIVDVDEAKVVLGDDINFYRSKEEYIIMTLQQITKTDGKVNTIWNLIIKTPLLAYDGLIYGHSP